MITDTDVKKLKESFKDTFVTKDDLKAFATKDDLKVFATKDDLKKALYPVNKKLNKIVKYFDRDISWHNRRLKQLEEKAGLKTPDFVLLPLMKN